MFFNFLNSSTFWLCSKCFVIFWILFYFLNIMPQVQRHTATAWSFPWWWRGGGRGGGGGWQRWKLWWPQHPSPWWWQLVIWLCGSLDPQAEAFNDVLDQDNVVRHHREAFYRMYLPMHRSVKEGTHLITNAKYYMLVNMLCYPQWKSAQKNKPYKG